MSQISETFYQFDEFRLDVSRRLLTRNGERVPVAPKSFEVLLYLVQHSGKVVLKNELLEEVWPDSFVEESNLSQHIFWLRKALGDRASCIATIPGRGYEFHTEVRTDTLTKSPVEAPAPPTEHLHVRVDTESTRITVKETVLIAARARTFSVELRWGIAAAAMLLLALAAWGTWYQQHRVVPGDHHEVVLADFSNTTPDPDLGRTLKTLLAIDLSQSPYLVVATDSQVRDTLGLMDRPPDAPMTNNIALEVCQRLNDQVVLTGQVASLGARYVVSLSAIDCQNGRALNQSKANADSLEGVVRAVDSVAAEIRRHLGEQLPSQKPANALLREHTVSLEALRSFSQAMNMWNQERAAIPLFRRAVELDPQFVWGYVQLSHAYGFEGELALQKEYLLKAYSMRDQLNDYQRSAVIDDYDDLTGVDPQKRLLDLQSWAALYPNQTLPLGPMVDVLKGLGRYEEAIAPARRAMVLQPNEVGAYIELASALAASGHTQEAKAVCKESFRRNLDSIFLHVVIYGIAIQEHDQATILAEDAWAKDKEDGVMFPVWRLMGEGRARDAIARDLQSIEDLRKQGFQEHADRRLRGLMHRESMFKMNSEIRDQLKSVDVRKYPDNLVFVLADMGHIKDAEMELRLIESDDPTRAAEDACFEPRAAVDAALGKLERAISDLEHCRKFGMAAPDAIVMLGQDYLDAGKPELAEQEFRYLLNHSFDTMGFLESLARLGLARAITRQGDYVNGRRAYEAVFVQWKEADPDLPLLLQAKREYENLQIENKTSSILTKR